MSSVSINLSSSQSTTPPIFINPLTILQNSQNAIKTLTNYNTNDSSISPFGSLTINDYNFNKYDDVMSYIEKFFLTNMLYILNGNIEDGSYCSGTNIEGNKGSGYQGRTYTSQTSSIVILPGAQIKNCTFDINISTTVDKGSLCYNINKRLQNMSESEKLKIINKVIINLESNSEFMNKLSNKKRFFNLLKDLLTNNLVISSGEAYNKCSQEVTVQKTQQLTLGGKVNCFNSTFKLDNNLVLKSFLYCLVLPSFDNVKKNVLLKNYFVQGDNSDCIYYKKIVEPCNTSTKKRKYEINILQPQIGTGICNYSNGQVITDDCEVPTCKVGPWSEWSDCKLIDATTSTLGKKTRIREYITRGQGCEGIITKEEIICTDFRVSPNNELSSLQRDGTWANLLTKGQIRNTQQILVVTLIVIAISILIFLLK